MTATQIAVTLAGVAAIALVVWFFWLKKEEGVRAAFTSGGYQEATILVQGGYTPDTVVVESGTPLRLVFRREETSPCSETVVFDDFGKSANLPQGQPVAVELMPSEPGRYRFTCGMGMLQGTLVVE
ncbi:MAG: cupredoxin domain-containing protein [Gaiellaceae bacterium]